MIKLKIFKILPDRFFTVQTNQDLPIDEFSNLSLFFGRYGIVGTTSGGLYKFAWIHSCLILADFFRPLLRLSDKWAFTDMLDKLSRLFHRVSLQDKDLSTTMREKTLKYQKKLNLLKIREIGNYSFVRQFGRAKMIFSRVFYRKILRIHLWQ